MARRRCDAQCANSEPADNGIVKDMPDRAGTHERLQTAPSPGSTSVNPACPRRKVGISRLEPPVNLKSPFPRPSTSRTGSSRHAILTEPRIPGERAGQKSARYVTDECPSERGVNRSAWWRRCGRLRGPERVV